MLSVTDPPFERVIIIQAHCYESKCFLLQDVCQFPSSPEFCEMVTTNHSVVWCFFLFLSSLFRWDNIAPVRRKRPPWEEILIYDEVLLLFPL